MRISLAILPLCLGTAALAADNAPDNMFSADLTNPDLALAVSHFEETCMPFVLHETELPREMDIRHMAKLMESRSYVLKSSETKTVRIKLAPAVIPLDPAKLSRTDRHYRQFKIQLGEIIGPVTIPATYKTVKEEVETYLLSTDERLSSTLWWNYPTKNHPGKSCEINLITKNLTPTQFTTAFIGKDSDWNQTESGWKQCVHDGEDEFEFAVQHNTDALTLKIRRNSFYQPHICTE